MTNSLSKIFVLIIVLFILSCKNISDENSQKTEFDTCQQIKNDTDSNYSIYVIPSPMQVSTVLKVTESSYDSEIISSFSFSKNQVSRNNMAINLGINIVDLGYSSLYDQKQISNKLANNIDNIIDELDLENQDYLLSFDNLMSNNYNKNIVSKNIISCLNSINNILIEKNEKDLSVLILCGVFIESQYILLKNYNEISKSHNNNFAIEQLNSILFQQETYLDNLIELSNSIESNISKDLKNDFNKIKVNYSELKISVNYDIDNKKINNILLDNKQIGKFLNQIIIIRDKIFKGQL